MMSALRAGPEEIELAVFEQVARIDIVEGGAQVPRAGVIGGVGGDGTVPVVDGGELGRAAEEADGLERAGRGAAGPAEEVGDFKGGWFHALWVWGAGNRRAVTWATNSAWV